VLREPVPSHALAPPNAFVGRDLFELPSLHGRSAFSLSRFARLIARLSLKIAEMPRVSQGRKDPPGVPSGLLLSAIGEPPSMPAAP